MFDDFRAYVFKTTDGGKTWTNISGNLPERTYVQVVREDPKNSSLLFAGTENGLFVSYSGGKEWIRLNLKNLANVSVHDILVHPRDNDLILATHGLSFQIFDDLTPIQQMTPAILNNDVHLFPIRPGLRFTQRFTRYGVGEKRFAGRNPPYGALITYYLKEKPDEKSTFKIQVLDREGRLIQEIQKPAKEKGLNRITWDLRYTGPELRRPPSDEETAFGGGPRGPQVLPGVYRVKLIVGDKTVDQPVEVRLDPTISVPPDDLQAQLDLLLKIRDRQTAGNTALRYLDSIKEQLKHSETTVKALNKEPDKDLMKALTDYQKLIDDLLKTMGRPAEPVLGLPGGSRVIDKLGGLFGGLDDVNAAPTAGQQEYFKETRAGVSRPHD